MQATKNPFQSDTDTTEMEATYKYDHQSKDIFKRLDDMRRNRLFCDATLATSDGVHFAVHRNILAAASPYFRAMFCSGFKEARSNGETSIILPEVTSVCLCIILECIYSDTLTLTNDTVYDVMAVAHMWWLDNIVSSCTEHIVHHISEETCIKSLKVAERFDLSNVRKVTETYILRHFVKLCERKEFLELPRDTLCRYLQDDALMGEEIEIFKAAKQWLEFDVSRFNYVSEVMGFIRFQSMTTDQLVDEVTNVDLLRGNSECFRMVLEALKYQANIYSQPLKGSTSTRGIEKVVVIEEGESGRRGYAAVTPGTMYIYNKSDIEAGDSVTLSCEVQQLEFDLIESSMNLVTVGNFLFLFGTDNSYNNVAKRFDGSKQTWLDMAPILRPAVVASTMGIAGTRHIVAVGGMLVSKESKQIRDGSKLNNSVYRYSVRSNCWKKRLSFPSRVAYAVSCSNQGTLYVAGGVVPQVNKPLFYTRTATSSVFTWKKLYSFDNTANLWLCKAPMHEARSEAIFEAVNSQLFLLGGCRDEDDEPVPSIEAYNIQTDQWSFVEKEPGFPYDAAASFVDGDDIFILGGYNYKNDLASNNITMLCTSHKNNTGQFRVLKPKLRNITCQHVTGVLKMPLPL